MATHENERVRRDEANVGPDPRQARSLVPMRTVSKLKIADGEPDIRGWSVFTSHGREIGEVQELLVDTTSMEVVMLDIDLRRDDRRTLAPIRAAWVDRPNRRVVIDAGEIGADEDLPALPKRQALTDTDVEEFDRRYTQAYGDRAGGEHDYRYRYNDEEELRFARGDRQAVAPAAIDSDREVRRGRTDADVDDVERERMELAREQDRLARERAELESARDQLAEERERIASTSRDRPVERTRHVERRRWSDDPSEMPIEDRPHSVRFPRSDRGSDIPPTERR